MRQVRPKVIIAETVTQFGLQPYERGLGDIYAWVRTVVSAAKQGWVTTRVRQFVFVFFTLLSNMRGTNCKAQLFFEMVAAMGFPITEAARGAPGASRSSRRSVSHHVWKHRAFELGGGRESCVVLGLAVLRCLLGLVPETEPTKLQWLTVPSGLPQGAKARTRRTSIPECCGTEDAHARNHQHQHHNDDGDSRLHSKTKCSTFLYVRV